MEPGKERGWSGKRKGGLLGFWNLHRPKPIQDQKDSKVKGKVEFGSEEVLQHAAGQLVGCDGLPV